MHRSLVFHLGAPVGWVDAAADAVWRHETKRHWGGFWCTRELQTVCALISAAKESCRFSWLKVFRSYWLIEKKHLWLAGLRERDGQTVSLCECAAVTVAHCVWQCGHVRVCHCQHSKVTLVPLLMSTLYVLLSYWCALLCALCLFNAMGRGVGVLQIPIIIISSSTYSKG